MFWGETTRIHLFDQNKIRFFNKPQIYQQLIKDGCLWNLTFSDHRVFVFFFVALDIFQVKLHAF